MADARVEFEVEAGETPKGATFVIIPTATGMYKIDYKGAGAPPAITNQLFTSLLLARRALDNYRRALMGEYAKEELKNKIVNSPTIKEQRKAESLKLKNGELKTVPDDDEE